MALRKRGKTWWMYLKINDTFVQKSLNTKSKSTAKKLYSAIEYELALGKYPAFLQVPVKSITFENMCLEHLEWSKAHLRSWAYLPYRFKILYRFFNKDKPFDKITVQDIEKFIIERKKDRNNLTGKPISNSGVNRDLLCLQAVYRTAVSYGYVKDNLVKRVQKLEESSPKIEYLQVEEIHRLLAVTEGWLKCALLISIYCGLRKSETFGLKWTDIDFENKIIKVFMPKTQKYRVAFATDIVFNELSMLPRKSEYIFINRHGKPLKGVRASFRKYLEKAKVRLIMWKTLRSTFATQLAMCNCGAYALMANMGHSGTEMALKYVQIDDSYRLELAQRLEERLAPGNSLIDQKDQQNGSQHGAAMTQH